MLKLLLCSINYEQDVVENCLNIINQTWRELLLFNFLLKSLVI